MSDTADVQVVCIAATDSAILVVREEDYDENERDIDPDAKIWIPQSQVDDDSEVWKKGDRGKLVIPMWLAEKKDLCR